MTNLETILAPYNGRKREALLPVLWDVQTTFGYISPEAVHEISHVLRVPEVDIYGVITFYTLFHAKPTGKKIIRVCTDPSCGLAGADEVLHQVCSKLGIQAGETTADGEYTIEHSPCLGLCDHAPAALISEIGEGEVAAGSVTASDLLNGERPSLPAHVIGSDSRILLKDPGFQRLDAYGDYRALRSAILDQSPEAIIETVTHSGLIGRGGAAFPTGMKWRFARQAQADQHYFVCNADESEPGTFKDRILMETRPHLMLEGMAIGAYAIGADKGYIFVRGEYPEAPKRVQAAIDEAEAAGLLGANIMGSDFSFHVEIRRGAGAYICGEETALFEAIEGKRGFPRIKPPYPTTFGLFGKPTAINNVETLSAVPEMILQGADWFKSHGTDQSTGTKLVSISGHIRQPGVYEIVLGMPLRQLIDRHCGGVDGTLQAVLMGGAAGTFLTPDEVDVPLTFEDLSAVDGTFGSGAIMVFNDTVDIRDVLQRLARFFQHESCGKCFPCQLGTQRQMEILERAYRPMAGDVQRLQDVGWTMTEASICGLGQTAASAVLSAIEKFPHLFAES